MSTEVIASTPAQLFFPHSSFLSHRIPSTIPSPRLLTIFSPVQASFAPPHTPPLSPILSDLPLNRKRSRFPTPDSDTGPSSPPAKRVRSDINLESGADMGDMGVAKGDLITGYPLSGDVTTPLSVGGAEMGRQRKMRLTLRTDIATPSRSSTDYSSAEAVDMPASPSSLPSPSSTSRHSSPPTLPPAMSIKRNPKRLSLAIPTSEAGPSSITISRSLTPPSDSDSTPFTPGPPQTPAISMTLGRQTKARRPNLLSLITHPPSAYDVPPTPSMSHPYPTARLPRRRSNTAEDVSMLAVDPRSSRSAHPRLSSAFAPIQETGLRVESPTASSSHTASLSSTPSSSPSVSRLETPYASRSTEPYGNGPIEIVPGVFLGAEDSMYEWSAWAKSSRVRILNVAQEIDDPFAAECIIPVSRKGKGKVRRAVYAPNEAEGRPEIEYCHLAWSHGESGLAELDSGMKLSDVVEGRFVEEEVEERDNWRFWEAIRYMEQGRQRGEAVLIHCQCGVSRSATLIIAYTMALAASGRTPTYLGHLKGMQDSYDFIKAKSCWIGPNVSLVFQLVEFARNLTTLLSAYHLSHPASASHIQTSFPSAEKAAQTEADWARQRAQFDQDNYSPIAVDPSIISPSGFSPSTGDGLGYVVVPGSASKIRVGMRELKIDEEAMRKEAVLLDEAMRVRRSGRV